MHPFLRILNEKKVEAIPDIAVEEIDQCLWEMKQEIEKLKLEMKDVKR